jgi:ribitol-5-phosphate 2-dehydrogenase
LLTGICQSDLRYFFGKRDPEVLKKKYPLCLLHEGIAEVVEPAGRFAKGDKVVIVPNIPCYIHNPASGKCDSCADEKIGENYCRNVKFMSSNCNGMSQTYFLQPIDCAVKVPDSVPDEIAVLTELMTCVYRATVEADIKGNDKIVVFGSGPTGYLLAALLYFGKNIPKENLYVADIDDNKLKNASSFAITVNTKAKGLPKIEFDKAFECVGGKGSEAAINQAIELLKPKGTLILMGVSEETKAVYTRTILDKGLLIKGTTRSPGQDYPAVLKMLNNKEMQNALSKIICPEIFKAESAEGLIKAFKKASDPNHYGKVLISWKV